MQVSMRTQRKSVPKQKEGLWTRFKNKVKSTKVYQKIVYSERFQKFIMSKPVVWTVEKWYGLKNWVSEKWNNIRNKFRNR